MRLRFLRRGIAGALIFGALTASANSSADAQQATGTVKIVALATDAEQPISTTTRVNDPALYIVEKTGRLRAYADGNIRQTPVLDIRTLVSTQNERGLHQAAFPPGPPTYVYVTYAAVDGSWTLAEFPFDGLVADSTKERVLLQIPHPNDDHYGGSLAFTPDGLLLVGLGDGGGVGTKGGAGDVNNNAQSLDRWFGKLLRMNPRPPADGSLPYQIPSTNPFAIGKASVGLLGAAKTAKPEIYAYGLRNPWRIYLEPDGTLWIADTGQSNWEEVNRVSLKNASGANFGWKLREGTRAYKGGAKPKGAIDPVHEFSHTNSRCAVIGGAVAQTGSLAGSYVFGDLCSGTLWAVKPGAGGRFVETKLPLQLRAPTSVGIDAQGELVVTSFYGTVARIVS